MKKKETKSKTITPYKELTGEKREKFKKWLKQFQKENDRSPTIEEVYDEVTKELKETYKKQRNKRIDELQKKNNEFEKQISILLSCKDCPDNKGGYKRNLKHR